MLSFETISSKKLFCELTAAAGLLWGVIVVDDVVVAFFVRNKDCFWSIVVGLVIPDPTTDFLAAEPEIECLSRRSHQRRFTFTFFFWLFAVDDDVEEIWRLEAASAAVFELTLSSYIL